MCLGQGGRCGSWRGDLDGGSGAPQIFMSGRLMKRTFGAMFMIDPSLPVGGEISHTFPGARRG